MLPVINSSNLQTTWLLDYAASFIMSLYKVQTICAMINLCLALTFCVEFIEIVLFFFFLFVCLLVIVT